MEGMNTINLWNHSYSLMPRELSFDETKRIRLDINLNISIHYYTPIKFKDLQDF